MTELFLYVGNRYFNAFCTRVHKMLSDKVYYAFSSAYSIQPTPTAQEPSNPHLISYEDGELEEDGPYSWYQPEANSTKTSLNTDPKTNPKVSWSPSTKPLAPIAAKHTKTNDFQLGMELTYNDGQGESQAVAYDRASADGKSHTVHTKDGSKFVVHESNLQLLNQPDFANIPKTPLDYRNEVGTVLTLPEDQALAIPTALSPVHQELMSWNHNIK